MVRLFSVGILFLLFLSGCSKYYLTIEQEWIDGSYLASERVNTPDPRRDHPPNGQMLILSWRVPNSFLAQKPKIVLDLLFKDLTTTSATYSMKSSMGDETYSILNDAFYKTKGFLAYQAYVITEDGKKHYLWRHQLWVELINLEGTDEL